MKKFFLFCVFFFYAQLLGFKHFVLVSAPGSGKGTFAQYLSEKYGYKHIAIGDILRHEIKQQTAFGKTIEHKVKNGEYLDQAIIDQLVIDNIGEILNRKQFFIIDGFPRCMESFDVLYSFLKHRGIVDDVCFLQLSASNDTCVERILNRRVCTNCHTVYSISFKKNICESCGCKLTKRADDTAEKAEKRLQSFFAHAELIMSAAKNIYHTVVVNTECRLADLLVRYDTMAQ